ncbi:MAG: hypothetical protein L3J70_04040 [Gammaproteobacteria bacterium]|nr:hypothetical protein [Gammaproteobacteria bacterium]
MKSRLLFITILIFNISCTSHTIANKNYNEFQFSKIKSDYLLTDSNNYGCKKIDNSVIMHVLKTGTVVTDREVHDHFSTTGCSIRGSMVLDGAETDFTFDYGGIIYFSSGMILGCSKECCGGSYLYCSWDGQNLKGL